MRRQVKQAVMWLYCRGFVAPWFVRVCFSVLRLKAS